MKDFCSLEATYFRVFLIWWIIHSCILVSGNTVWMASGKPFRPSIHTIRISSTPSVFQFIAYLQPEFCAFILANPHTQDIFIPFWINAQRHITGFCYDVSVLTDFKVDCIHIYYRIKTVKSPGIPFIGLFHHLICDIGNRGWRQLNAVQCLYILCNVTHCHPLGIHGNNLGQVVHGSWP